MTVLSQSMKNISEQFSNVPSLTLQAAALIGCLATVLLFRGKLALSETRSGSIGLVLGITCFIVISLVQEEMRATTKKVIMVDYIFLSGLIGGWRNGIITLAFAIGTRVIYGGEANLYLACLDLVCILVGSLIGHAYLQSSQMDFSKIKSFIVLVFARFFAGTLSIFVLMIFDLLPQEQLLYLFIKRAISSFTISGGIIVVVMLLLRYAIERENSIYIDQASRLPNRRALQKDLENIKINRTPRRPKTLLLLTLSNSYPLIHTYGHTWMDAFVASLGRAIAGLGSLVDISSYNPKCYSFSDTSFVVIFHNVSKEEIQKKGTVQRLLSVLKLTMEKPGMSLLPSFTASVMNFSETSEFDQTHLLRTLTLLEEQPTGTIRFIESTIDQQVRLEKDVFALLGRWIKGEAIPIWFQPKVILQDGRCYGGEGLLRIKGLTKAEYANPHDVLAIAEKFHLRQQVEWHITCQVLRSLKQLPPHLAHLKLAVNLTPDTFTHQGFAQDLILLMKQENIAFHRLIIEVIETSKTISSQTVKENLSYLLRKGVTLSLDDFGTGYSSLALLSEYQFKELKLDYAMTSNMNNSRGYAAVQASAQVAERYRIPIVAEGIETKEQQQQLQELGIRHGQGFLFGKAMPLDQFILYAEETLIASPALAPAPLPALVLPTS